MSGSSTVGSGSLWRWQRWPRSALLLCALAWLTAPATAAVCTLSSDNSRQSQEFVSTLEGERDIRHFHMGNFAINGVSECELVITLGAAAATRMAAWPAPVLHALISREQYLSLYADPPRYPRSAVFAEPPLANYLSLIATTLPGHSHILLLSSERTAPLLDALHGLASATGRSFQAVEYHSGMLFDDVLKKYGRSDTVLLILPDGDVLNSSTARPLIMAAYQRAVPMVSYSQGLVRAGALMAVYSTTEQQAEAARAVIRQWRGGEGLAVAGYPEGYSIAINYQLARAMRLRIPAEQVVLDAMQQVTNDE